MKILAIQNRMGIGDMVIFLPYIEAIAKKFKSNITILAKENTKADQLTKENKYINRIIILRRSNSKKDYHDGFAGFFKLASDLKKHNFDKAIIFNSSLRYNLVCKLAGIKEIYQYPLFRKKNQHITEPANNLIKENFNLVAPGDPKININEKDMSHVRKKFNFENNSINILLGIGGSGPTKRIPPDKFIKLIDLCIKDFNCRFFLATGNNKEELGIMNEILNAHEDKCVPLNKLNIIDTLPIIKNCNVAVCNDSSFSHLSAGLGKPTIVLMADTPMIYGSYNSKMRIITPDGFDYVTHGTNGKNNINPEKIFNILKTIIS